MIYLPLELTSFFFPKKKKKPIIFILGAHLREKDVYNTLQAEKYVVLLGDI